MSNMLLNNKLKVLNEFSRDYNKKIYGRELAIKLKMNQKTASNIMIKLEKENILKFSQEGRNKYYYLNKFNKEIKEILKISEINRKIKFLEKYKKIKDLFYKIEERSFGIVVVFGSYAKETSTEKSDLDLFAIGKISSLEDLEELYNIKINVVELEKSKFNKEDAIIKEIINNHIILKGVETFINLIW